MSVLHQIIVALCHQDFATLANPKMTGIVYVVLFTLLFLENSLLPAAFLPGDSLLLLTGALVAKGVLGFFPALLILTCAASLGCWAGYLQGRWLGNTPLMQRWLTRLPARYYQRACDMFEQHGLAALLIGRFLAFVRTLLPLLAGVSRLNALRFQLFNWVSAVIWIGLLVSFGYGISQVPLIQRHESQLMTVLMLVPLLLMAGGLLGSMMMVWRKKQQSTE